MFHEYRELIFTCEWGHESTVKVVQFRVPSSPPLAYDTNVYILACKGLHKLIHRREPPEFICPFKVLLSLEKTWDFVNEIIITTNVSKELRNYMDYLKVQNEFGIRL